jgi:hypothetical protein
MRKIQLIFLFLCTVLYAQAQELKPVYFRGNSVTTDKTRATSYGVYGKLSTEDLWTFKRFDLYDNLIQTGAYKDDKLTIPHGDFLFYTDVDEFNEINGTSYILKGRYRFLSQQGTYVDGLEQGKWLLFYPDGKVLSAQQFVDGKLNGEFVNYDSRGRVEVKGRYVADQRDGEWIFKGGKLREVYANGVLISSEKVGKQRNKVIKTTINSSARQ